MQVFRNSAKPVLVLLAVTTFVWLVVDMSGIAGTSSVLTQTNAGKVNGTAIDLRQYELQVQDAVQRQRASTGSGLEAVAQVRDQVWDAAVTNVLLADQYKKRGITVSDDELIATLRGEPPQEFQSAKEFQTDGQFDLAKYQRFLGSSGARGFIDQLAVEYRDRIKRAKLARQVTADVTVSDAALWEQYRDGKETVRVGLSAMLPEVLVPDTAIAVTPSELQRYFQAHRADFVATRTAYLSYVTLPRLANASDTAFALARVKEVRDELAKGAPFAEVAKRESSDSGSASRGGDLGEWTKGSFDPAFEKVAWSIALNTVSEPVLTPFGYHLIEVTSRTADKAKGRHILIPIDVAGEHRDHLDAQADTLDRLAAEQNDPAALDTVARALKVTVQRAEPVVEGQRVRLGPILVPDAGIWAFQHKPGSISNVIETDVALYVFRLDSVAGGKDVTLGQVASQVTQKVRAEKKKAMVKDLATTFLAKLVTGQPMRTVATDMKLPFREFGPFSRINPPITDPIVVGAAFGLQTGQTSGLIESRDGGIYVVQALERVKADSAAFVKELPQLRTTILRQRQQERIQNFMASLRANATIVDNRKKIEEQTAARS